MDIVGRCARRSCQELNAGCSDSYIDVAVVLMEVLLDMSFAAPSIASARYSSTSGFSGGLTTGSTFVLLPMPKKPVVVTVVAIGLYWLDSFRAWLAVSMDTRDSDDSSGAEY